MNCHAPYQLSLAPAHIHCRADQKLGRGETKYILVEVTIIERNNDHEQKLLYDNLLAERETVRT
jgi:hypothetical protein